MVAITLAGTTGKISGFVKDKNNGEPLIWRVIFIS